MRANEAMIPGRFAGPSFSNCTETQYASVSVCPSPGRSPATVMVAPGPPFAGAWASKLPARMPRRSGGRITRQNTPISDGPRARHVRGIALPALEGDHGGGVQGAAVACHARCRFVAGETRRRHFVGQHPQAPARARRSTQVPPALRDRLVQQARGHRLVRSLLGCSSGRHVAPARSSIHAPGSGTASHFALREGRDYPAMT
jgi:hypothetical protein